MLKQIGNAKQMKMRRPRRLQRYLHRKVTVESLLSKIEKKWSLLDAHKNAECKRLEDQIKSNKLCIQQLTRENLFEIDVNTNDQKLLLKVQDSRTKKDRRLKQTQEEYMVQKLQTRLREEIAIQEERDTWGL